MNHPLDSSVKRGAETEPLMHTTQTDTQRETDTHTEAGEREQRRKGKGRWGDAQQEERAGETETVCPKGG